MKIQFNNLYRQWSIIKDQTLVDLDKLFLRSDFILGSDVKKFETKFAEYLNIPFAVGVSNGTDALKLAALSLDIKGSTLVIIPANTYIATLFGIENAIPDADFSLLDCDEYYQLDMAELETTISKERKNYENIIVVCVHLYGYTCDMQKILSLCSKHNCFLIEDTSQAHGAKAYNQYAGTFGDVSAFSLYPGKNLGCAGDGGVVVTRHKNIYDKLLFLRNLGSVEKYQHTTKGFNHRLDTLQAIILNHKLDYLEEWNEQRRKIVKKMETNINNEQINLPITPGYCSPVHHIYPVLTKNKKHFQDYLQINNIEYGMHYPIPIELTPMYQNNSKVHKNNNPNTLKYCDTATSLPIHPFLNDEEVDYMINILNQYQYNPIS
jgi:dTDP-4-amino-4,6-dideoxygalactose transaminase